MDIVALHRRGFKQRTIARKLGVSRNTVKKHIDNPDLVFGQTPIRLRKSQLDRENRHSAIGFLSSVEYEKQKEINLLSRFYLFAKRPPL